MDIRKIVETMAKQVVDEQTKNGKQFLIEMNDLATLVAYEPDPDIQKVLLHELAGVAETLLEAQENKLGKAERSLFLKLLTSVIHEIVIP